MRRPRPALFTALLCFLAATLRGTEIPAPMQSKFDSLNQSADWQVTLTDPGTGDWREHWFLDGEKAKVINTPAGLELRAGETPGENEGHLVLWTKREFSGDLRVRFKFTRLDESTKFVNILYLKATGTGEAEYVEDITKWSERRRVPLMKTYYERMKLWHISFAAFGNETSARYIRARRYPSPARDDFPRFNKETVIPPDYEPGGLFATGVEHEMTFILAGNDLFFFVATGTEERLCHWDLSQLKPLEKGRIGLRLMASRASRFAEIEVATRK